MVENVVMRRRFFRPAWIALAVVAGSVVISAQSTRVEDLGVGKLLVARRDAPDPIFAETVILLVRYQRSGTVGLVINRRTKVAIAKTLKELNGAKRRSEPVYLGGPVETDSVLALLHANVMPEGPVHVSGKVYLVTAKSLLEKTLAGGARATELRVYLGYCGWSNGQLEREVRQGVWDVFSSNADLAFDPEPNTLWTRLIAREEQNIAHVQVPAHPPELFSTHPRLDFRFLPSYSRTTRARSINDAVQR
jgi:putative transcriptional regulator